MALFDIKKSKKQPNSKIIFMPQKQSSLVKRNTRSKNIFNISNKKKPLRKNKKDYSKILKSLLIIPTIFLIFMLGYFSIKLIERIRQKEVYYEEKDVVGLENIPAFPQSQFIFENNMNDTSVSAFISSGKSAYKIIGNKNIEDVYKYYNQKLPDLGWTYIQTVPTASEEMKSGMYWEKNGSGLRIYSKFKDIWYEIITKEEAENGLKTRVQEAVKRDLLLATQDNQDLLPDYPWIAHIPKKFLITYRASEFENLRTVEFRKLGTDSNIFLVPIGKYTSQPLDVYLNTYISTVNQQDSAKNCIITSTVLAYTQYSSALKSVVTCSDAVHNIAVIINPNNSVVYVIDSNKPDEEFFNVLFEQLKPSATLTY